MAKTKTDIRKNRDQILSIIATVTKSPTKKIWGGTKIETIFSNNDPSNDDDVWTYYEFCDNLESEFGISLSTNERLDMLDMTLMKMEIFLIGKIEAQSAQNGKN